jgi:hypothetical protein
VPTSAPSCSSVTPTVAMISALLSTCARNCKPQLPGSVCNSARVGALTSPACACKSESHPRLNFALPVGEGLHALFKPAVSSACCGDGLVRAHSDTLQAPAVRTGRRLQLSDFACCADTAGALRASFAFVQHLCALPPRSRCQCPAVWHFSPLLLISGLSPLLVRLRPASRRVLPPGRRLLAGVKLLEVRAALTFCSGERQLADL